MPSLPLHPAIVHIPLGLSVVLPLLAAALTVALWRRWLTPRAFAILVLLQALVVGAGLVALQTGEADEERAEAVVAEQAIEDHEHAAQRFMVGAALALALGVATLVAGKREKAMRAFAVTATVATVATAALGIAAGRAGGALVYSHGAASAFASTAAVQTPDLITQPADAEGADADDHDD